MSSEPGAQAAVFEGIDWSGDGGRSITRVDVIELFTYALVLIGFYYDYAIIDNAHPIFSPWLRWDVTSVEWLLVPVLLFSTFHAVVPLARNRRYARYLWRRFTRNPVAVIALAYVILIFATGMVGPAVMDPPGSEPLDQRLTERLEPPVGVTTMVNGEVRTGSWEHPLGTTREGVGILKLIIYGMRVSVEVGLISAVIATALGSLIGATAAYATASGKHMVDEVLMRYLDLQSVFPAFIMLLLVGYIFGFHLWFIIVLFGFFGFEGIARTVRGEALQRTQNEYITAAEAAGGGFWYTVRRHVIPNCSHGIITVLTLAIPHAVLGEATLSFLGFSDPTTFSWGQTIQQGQGVLAMAPWVSTIPGVFLFLFCVSICFIGDAAMDALNPEHTSE